MIDRGTPKYEKGRISKAVAEQLYTDKLFGSVTRFEQYAKCPFAHFALYGLGVREREEFAVNAMVTEMYSTKHWSMFHTGWKRKKRTGILFHWMKSGRWQKKPLYRKPGV